MPAKAPKRGGGWLVLALLLVAFLLFFAPAFEGYLKRLIVPVVRDAIYFHELRSQ